MVCAWFTHGLRKVYAWFTHGLRMVYANVYTEFTQSLRTFYADYVEFTQSLRRFTQFVYMLCLA
jgi:hypothetical protein